MNEQGRQGIAGRTGSFREVPSPVGGEAKRLRNHRVKIFTALTAPEIEAALTAWFKPGLDPDGITERRDQREMLYPPDVVRDGGTWYAVVFFVE